MRSSFVAGLIGTAVLAIVLPMLAGAQSSFPNPFEQMGISANGTYTSGGFDNVSMQSGNLSGRIPLFSIPQKGDLTLSFSLDFNNSGWKYYETCDETSCYEGVNRPRIPIGPVIVMDQDKVASPVDAGLQLLDLSQEYFASFDDPLYPGCALEPTGADGCEEAPLLCPGNECLPYTTLAYSVQEPDGAEHLMYFDAANLSQLRSVDGSGYLFVPNQTRPFDVWNYAPGLPYTAGSTLIDRNGLKYSFDAVTPENPSPNPPYTISDANGNSLRVNESGNLDPNNGVVDTVVTDSLDRPISGPSQISSSTAGCPAQTALYQPTVGSSTWTVPGPNGNVTYLICYTNLYLNVDFTITTNQSPVTLPISPQTSYGAPANGQFGLCANPVGFCAIQSVVLPNTSYWMFTYSASDPNNVSSIADGDIVGIRMPSGATVRYSYNPGGPVDSISPQGIYRTVHTRSVADQSGNQIMGPWTYTWDVRDIIAGDAPYSNNVSNPDGSTFTYSHQYGSDCLIVNPGVCPETEGKVTLGPHGEQETITTTRWRRGIPSPADKIYITSLNDSPSYWGAGGYFQCPLPTDCFQFAEGTYGDASMEDAVYSETTQHQFAASSAVFTETTTYDQAVSGVIFPCNPIGYFEVQGIETTTPDYCAQLSNIYSDQSGYSGQPHPQATLDAPILAFSLGMPLTHEVTDYSGAIIENTTMDYTALDSSTYLSANMLSLPSAVKHYDASGATILAETDYAYDDSGSGPGGIRGLVTSTQQLVTSGAWLQTHRYYNADGTVSYSVDGNGNKTHIDSYDCSGIMPLSVTSGWQSTTTLPETTVTLHDCNTGKPTQVQGPNDLANGRTGTSYSYDSIGSVTGVTYPDGGSTAVNYHGYALPLVVSATTSASPNPNITATTNYDSAGRAITSNVSGGPTVATTYDLSGRVSTTSNAYYSLLDSTYGLTSFTYDGLGQKTIQTQPDNQKVQWCFDGVVASGQGNCLSSHGSFSTYPWADYSDEAGKHWQHITDGLGRLVSVLELNPTTAGGSVETDYQYDMLGNLLAVNQHGETRSFGYDGLSRVTSTLNREAGNITYSYSNGSNVPCAGDASLPCSKTDARNLTTTYTYDALNRLIQKVVPLIVGANGTVNGSVSTCYQYDAFAGQPSSANLIGHLSAEWTQTGSQCAAAYTPTVALTTSLVTSYDAMGRPLQSQQCLKGNCATQPFTQSQTYDLAGHPTAWQDGRGFMTFTQQFDAAGRSTTLTNNVFGNGLPPVLFSAQGYSPTGGLQEWNVGNFLNFNRSYDKRSRVTGETVTH